jgi:hypothetical protein
MNYEKYFVMRILMTIFFIVATFAVKAQDKVIVKYYDSLWSPVTKDKANFYAEFEKVDSTYKVTSYRYPSMKLFSKSTYADTLLRKGIGKTTLFLYMGDKVNDSATFNNIGSQNIIFKNGKYDTIYTVVQIPAEFPGGATGWINYLQENLRTNIPIKKKAPVGKYTVIVSFLVDDKGNVSDVKAENDPGYGTKEEAIRVLNKSPKWRPASQNGKNVIYRHVQRITFQVTEEK